MIYGILIGIVLGLLYYKPLEALDEVLSTTSMEELEELTRQIQRQRIDNFAIRFVVYLIRLPLMIPVMILVFIHMHNLIKDESK